MRPTPLLIRARRAASPCEVASRLLTAIMMAVVVLAVVLTVAGCDAVGNTPGVNSRTRLINDLADRLSYVNSLTYTAVYRLAGGDKASIAQAQQPARAAYTYPGGKVVLSPEYTAECTTKGNASGCTLTPGPSPSGQPTTTLLALIAGQGLIAPGTVVGLLAAAALDNTSTVEQHDTTVAGVHATCVDVSGVANAPASAFSVCITTDGLIGSFTGTVNGTKINILLDHSSPSVDSHAFDLPAHAKITDRRPH